MSIVDANGKPAEPPQGIKVNLKALWAKAGTHDFILLPLDTAPMLIRMTATNLLSLHSQLVAVLPALGINRFVILNADATEILADCNIPVVINFLEHGPLSQRIVAARAKLANVTRMMGRG